MPGTALGQISNSTSVHTEAQAEAAFIRRLNTNTINLTNATIASWDYADVTTGSVTRTITFPLSPIDGDELVVTKADNGSGNISVAGNGNNINGVASIVDIITAQYASVTFRFNGTEWRIK